MSQVSPLAKKAKTCSLMSNVSGNGIVFYLFIPINLSSEIKQSRINSPNDLKAEPRELRNLRTALDAAQVLLFPGWPDV